MKKAIGFEYYFLAFKKQGKLDPPFWCLEKDNYFYPSLFGVFFGDISECDKQCKQQTGICPIKGTKGFQVTTIPIYLD